MTGYSEPLTAINATGHLFTGNGVFTFTYADLAGHTGSVAASVSWIDKTSPVVTGNLPASGSTLTSSRDIPFSWAGSDPEAGISGYTLRLSGTNIAVKSSYNDM